MSRRLNSHASQLFAGRREFILGGASLAVLPWMGRFVLGAPGNTGGLSDYPFPLGVASGDPTEDGMVLWTRLSPRPLEGGGMPAESFEVTWELADDEAMKNIVRRGTAWATPQLGHSIHVELEGLDPNRWYWYRFRLGDAESPVGRTRTMPARDTMPEQLRFAFASCQHYEHGLFTAYDHMLSDELDLIVHLGDYFYEYEGKEKQIRKHTGSETTSLEDYRNRHALYRLDPHLQAAHGHCPWLVVWDDHEFDNNCACDISEESGVSCEDFLLRRANAYQAYYEHMPLRRRSLPLGPDMKLYRKITFGRLADFFMLDTRQYLTDQPNGDGLKPITAEVLDPRATLLGAEQERWLMQRLTTGNSRWNILGQQVMMARVDRVAGEEARYSMDQWAGYDVARRRLLSFLAERRVPNPVVLTGDIHSNWVNDLHIDFDRGEDPIVATEFVGTSISSGGSGREKPATWEALLSENPFVRFHNTERGYVRCTVTPQGWRSDYQVVPFVDRPGAPKTTRASFVVEHGRPGAVEA